MATIRLDVLEKTILSEHRSLISIYDEIAQSIKDIAKDFRRLRVIGVVGCGDSYFSAIYFSYILRKLTNIVALSENAYEMYIHGPRRLDLLIAISASGETRATVDCARWAKKNNIMVVGVTCRRNSSLAEISDKIIYIPLEDRVAVPTVTSLGFFTALSLLALEIGFRAGNISEDDYRELSRRHRALVSSLTCMVGHTYLELIDSLIKKLSVHERNILYFLGGDSQYASALMAMAKFRELRILHSIAFELEEFMHYGSIPLRDDIVFIFVNKKTLERGVDAADLVETVGSKPVLVSNYLGKLRFPHISIIDTPDIFSPIPTLLLVHLLALKTAKTKYGGSVEIPFSSEISRKIRLR